MPPMRAEVRLKVGKGESSEAMKKTLLIAVAIVGMVAAAPPVFAIQITHEFSTPEPATLALFVTGLGALGLLVRLRKRKPRS